MSTRRPYAMGEQRTDHRGVSGEGAVMCSVQCSLFHALGKKQLHCAMAMHLVQ